LDITLFNQRIKTEQSIYKQPQFMTHLLQTGHNTVESEKSKHKHYSVKNITNAYFFSVHSTAPGN